MRFRVRRGPSRRRRVAGASTVSRAGRMHQGFRKELWTKLVEVLVIDEISMLSGEWLDNLERMLRELTHYYGRGEFQQYLRMPMKDIPARGRHRRPTARNSPPPRMPSGAPSAPRATLAPPAPQRRE